MNCCCNACSIPGPAGTGGVTLIGAAGMVLGTACITLAVGKPPPVGVLTGLLKINQTNKFKSKKDSHLSSIDVCKF